MALTDAAAKPLTGHRVLAIFVGFFGVVFAMNAVFLTAALRTNAGVVAVEPYRKGLDYNRRIAADARQKLRGWHSDASITSDGRLVVVLAAENGTPLAALNVAATIGRPATMSENVDLTLKEVAPGHYEANTPLDGTGAFVADIVVDAAPENPYRIRRRLWLKP